MMPAGRATAALAVAVLLLGCGVAIGWCAADARAGGLGHDGRAAPDGAAAADAGAEAPVEGDALDAMVARIAALHVADAEREALFARAAADGRLDALVERFAARAAAATDSADAQADHGDALVQQLRRAGNPLRTGALALRADRAYDAALNIDPQHWRARFSKAIGYANWPDFLGKKPEAIRHLEILVGQQRDRGARPEFVQAWLWLGELYAQQGRDAEARSVWSEGLQRHPDAAELQARLGG